MEEAIARPRGPALAMARLAGVAGLLETLSVGGLVVALIYRGRALPRQFVEDPSPEKWLAVVVIVPLALVLLAAYGGLVWASISALRGRLRGCVALVLLSAVWAAVGGFGPWPGLIRAGVGCTAFLVMAPAVIATVAQMIARGVTGRYGLNVNHGTWAPPYERYEDQAALLRAGRRERGWE